LSKKLYPYCLELVGSRNGFRRDFTIELKYIEGLMEDKKTKVIFVNPGQGEFSWNIVSLYQV